MNVAELPTYSVVRKLQGGGMTDLILALDESQQRVVIRYLRDEYAKDRASKKNFLRGQAILSSLHHPNIVNFIAADTLRGVPYMVLEYVESRTLRELITHRDPLLTQNTLSLMRQMAAALFYVHSKGFLHLDFKPENILIQENGHVVLIDFDLAIAHRGPHKLKKLPGTFTYIAPETLKTKVVDERSDIYAFGVTCYEMLTFRKPYQAETLDQARAAQMSTRNEATRPRIHNKSVPASLEAIVLKCLANKPNERYPSTSLIVKDLEAVLK